MSRARDGGSQGDRPSEAFQRALWGKSGPSGSGRCRPAPFSLRLTAEERAQLEAQAGDVPLGAYIRSRLLQDSAQPRQVRRKPVKDEEALARLLAELGNARLANNLNQLAKAANTGSLPVTPETLQAILTACRDVKTMRACLLAALGFRP